jgi:hypothetical protein
MDDDIVVVNKPASIPVGRLFLKATICVSVSHFLSLFLPFSPYFFNCLAKVLMANKFMVMNWESQKEKNAPLGISSNFSNF